MTFGTLKLVDKKWEIDAAPHVRTKLRRLFETSKRQSGSLIVLNDTPANSRELEWVIERYPLKFDDETGRYLFSRAGQQRTVEAKAHQILTGTSQALSDLKMALQLRSYQQTAYELIKTVNGALVADEMGLGKTVVGIACSLLASPTLVVCQSHLQTQWKDQFKKFLPDAKVRIAKTGKPEDLTGVHAIIIPYNKIHGWRDALADGVIQVMVLDELQELRAMDTQKRAACEHISKGATFRVGLTGTPVYNYGNEMFSAMDILRPGELGTLDEFHTEWCSTSRSGRKIVTDPIALRSFLMSQGMMIRRTRKDVGREIPPVTKIKHVVQYDAKIMEKFNNAALGLARVILQRSSDFNARGVAAREFDIKLRQVTGIAKAPYVAELLTEIATTDEKVIVGIWHREVYDIISAVLTANGIPHWFYSGSETPAQKEKNFKAFMEADSGFLLMSLRSGAGLDGLQYCCHNVVYAELDWTGQVHDQLTARVGRDGQENGVTALYCVSEGGSDPAIAGLLGLKNEQHIGLMDGIKPDDLISDQVPDSKIAELARAFLKNHFPEELESLETEARKAALADTEQGLTCQPAERLSGRPELGERDLSDDQSPVFAAGRATIL